MGWHEGDTVTMKLINGPVQARVVGLQDGDDAVVLMHYEHLDEMVKDRGLLSVASVGLLLRGEERA